MEWFTKQERKEANLPVWIPHMRIFQRGNEATTELLVAHLAENTKVDDFRWFLRTPHQPTPMSSSSWKKMQVIREFTRYLEPANL